MSMRLGKRPILRALESRAVRLAAVVVLAFADLGSAGLSSASANDALPPLKGEMGDFNYFASPRPVPAISFQDGSGKTLTLEDFKGRVVLVNFWATWCGPCLSEMPSLDRLQAKLDGRDFTVLDLSLDRQGKAVVEPYFAQNKLSHLGIYLDPKSQAFYAFRGTGVPTSFLIGREGLARGMLIGPAEWDSPAAIEFVEQFIGQGQKGATKLKQTYAPGRSSSARADAR